MCDGGIVCWAGVRKVYCVMGRARGDSYFYQGDGCLRKELCDVEEVDV